MKPSQQKSAPLGEVVATVFDQAERYSTNPAVNTWTYASINGMAIPHGVGSVWAQAAWEVYWKLVDHWGFDPNLYDATGSAGNFCPNSATAMPEGARFADTHAKWALTPVWGMSQRLPRLSNGSRVCVHGTLASVSQCLHQPTIEIDEIRNWSSCP